MLKGQIVAGDFSSILVRVKSDQQIELGELIVVEQHREKFILQVCDLNYGSQISRQNLEMVAGMNLEEGSFHIMDESLRNYQLALCKPLLTIGDASKTCKKLPPFFSTVRAIEKEDLSFITTPSFPLYLGKLRNGSQEMDFNIFLQGKDVLSHHVLIPASTGKGKSLGAEEPVLVRDQLGARVVPIGKLVDLKFAENQDKIELLDRTDETFSVIPNEDILVYSLNPKTHSCEWKQVQRFIRHKAPEEMYEVKTASGRTVIVTGDHNFLALRDGNLALCESRKLSSEDHIPQPLSLPEGRGKEIINLLHLFSSEPNVYAISENGKKIRLTELKDKELSEKQGNFIRIVGYSERTSLSAAFPLTNGFLRLLGYYVAEGYINHNSVRITNHNQEVQKDIKGILEEYNLSFNQRVRAEIVTDTLIFSSLFVTLLKKLSLGINAQTKRTPSFIFELSNEQLSHFLKAYFEGDGSAYRQGKRNSFEISASSKSPGLINELACLLLRFGIFARIRKSWKRSTNSSHKGDWYYSLIISGKKNIFCFMEQVGFITKGKKIKEMSNYVENTNVDLIPFSPSLLKEIRLSLRLNQEKLALLSGVSPSSISAIEAGRRVPSRETASAIIKGFATHTTSIFSTLSKELEILSQIPSYNQMIVALNGWRKECSITYEKLGSLTQLYSSSSHYAENDLGRIFSGKVISPKVFKIGQTLMEYSEKNNLSITALNQSSFYKYNQNELIRIVKKAMRVFSFPHQSFSKEDSRLGYYARQLYSGQQITFKNLLELISQINGYWTSFKNAAQKINLLTSLLFLRWDKVKEVTPIKYLSHFVYDLTVEDNHTFYAGSGGMFVHNSNLMSCILWDILGKNYAGILVLDPHDEYYGRTGLGLKDHPQRNKISYYTPANPPMGARTLKINLQQLKPEHFQGAIHLTDPQRQCLYAYYRRFKEIWISSLLEEKRIEEVKFHEDTLAVVKRKLISLLGLEIENNQLHCRGIFDETAGKNTISEICQDLEQGRMVIIDTSYFSGALEIMIGSLITSEIFEKYKWYKKNGHLDEKPVISVVLEEAPRVLGKNVLEQGSNIFETIAREGRKFKVGLIAITQLPSEIPKNILANMNTKIILGIEMNTERQAVIESSPQDLSQDNRNIASLDKGEALVTSTFTRFAVPIKVPSFKEFVKTAKKETYDPDYGVFA